MKSKLTYLSLTLLLFLLGNTAVHAQKLDIEKLKGIDVRSIGPAGMSGRVTAIDAVVDQPNIIYVGTASGGVWKSESGGIDWKPMFDEQPVMSIGSVSIQQDNPDVIWVGTGEGNPRNSLNGGYGIYKSLDAGKTWKLMGLEKTRNIHRIKIDPKNPNTVYAGAIGSPWGEHPERGVFKTTDGGKTWKNVLFTNNKSGAADLVMDPNNPNKLIAAMWEHRRKPWTFNSGGEGSGLYLTVDGGENWKKLGDEEGLPKGNLGRIGIAIAPSEPNRIYALVESKKNALYRSDDGGYKWKVMSEKGNEIGNRPFYYSEIYVDPVNENRLYTIFTYVNVSEDGGKTFTELMPAYGTSKGVHPDHHAWWINPKNPDFMMDGNDGGLNITHDGGKSWRFVENLPVGQFYHINVDNDYPYNVYGGMQDNGSWIGPAYVWKSQGIRNSYWQELAFGDGFDVVPDADNSRYGFAMSQQGFVVRYDRETGNNRIVRPTHPDSDMRLRFNWNSAIAVDPIDNHTVYFGSQFVHKSTDKGSTWEVISPDLTSNNPEKQKQHESGGLTIDATGAENNTTILAISPSPVKQGVIWVGTDDGIVQVSKDGGSTWANVSANITGMPTAGWVAQLKPSTYNAAEAFVVVNNYRNFDFKPYLFHTTDYGQTWRNIVSESQVWNYSLSFVQDPVAPNLLFLGSEGGLYVSIDKGRNWTQWTNNYPKVPTMDMIIHPREHDLVIGTFGRANYVMDDIRPLRALAKEGVGILNSQVKMFEPPTAYMSSYQQPTGTRFGGNATFNGQNRKYGAMISYLINKPEEKKEEPKVEAKKKSKKKKSSTVDALPEDPSADSTKIKYDSMVLEVFKGDVKIRTLKTKTPDKNGMHRMYWNLNEAGVRSASRSKPKPNAREPRGASVLPGTYKLRLTFGGQMDSTMIKVVFDPRIEMEQSVLVAQYNFQKRLEKANSSAFAVSQRLVESIAIAEGFMKKMKDLDKEKFKEQIELSKAMKDSLNAFFTPLMGEDNSKKQGIIRSPIPSIRGRIGTASFYAGSSSQAPGDTELRLAKQAEDELGAYIEKINAFYDADWKTYRAEMEKVELSPFKDYEKID
jgi:photosystem II stability/assembly factor-like uncharacterized protein